VQVHHRDGTVAALDLLRYYATGDLEHNPFLRDGDVVHMPAFHRQGEAVFVEDRFEEPRLYDLRPTDTAADLVAVARGPEASETLEAVRLVRILPDGSLTVQSFDGPDLEGALRATPLQALDRLLLVDPNELAGRIEVQGAVRFPGTYPVTDGVTTLQEVVARAGGLLPTALPGAAYLDRPGAQRTPNQPFDAGQRLANLEDQAYETGRLAALGFESRQYLSRALGGLHRVSIDLNAVLQGTAPPITLRDGDRLVVPEDPGGVLVVGQVNQPGLVPHRAGADTEHYIAQAGGLGPAATEVYLREAGSGALRPAGEGEIHSGDVLFVDRQAAAFSEAQQSLLLQRQQYEAQVRRDRAESRNRLFSAALGITSAVISVITIVVLSDNSGN
jgi:protein involved in polysaccharide export with SLBB domain